VRERKEQQERTEICKEEIAKRCTEERLNEAMEGKGTEAE
jgi:hypothetical protein